MYGLVDVGYTSHKMENSNASADTTKRSLIGSNGSATSRLGFKGTEDLGGGTSAGFTFETGLAPAGTANGAPSTATSGAHTLSAFDNRQAFVTMGNAKFGTLNVGRQYTTLHAIQTAFNAGGTNNIIGDVIYNQAEVVATEPANGMSGLRTGAAGKSAEVAPAYALRASNAVSYILPELSKGLTVGVSYATVNTNNNGTDAGSKGQSIMAKYTNGPLSLGASYMDATLKSPTAGNLATGVANQGATQDADEKIKNSIFGASYAIANANLFYQYVTLKTDDGTANARRTANKVGVNATYGNWVPFAQYGTSKISASTGNPLDGYKTTGMQLGTNYNMSKRTALYAIYGSSKGELNNFSAKETQYAFGVRHAF